MPQVKLEEIPENSRVAREDAEEYEDCGKTEFYNRLRPGDPHELTWALAPRGTVRRLLKRDEKEKTRGPKLIKVIDGRGMTERAKERWMKARLAEAQERLAEREEEEEEGADGAKQKAENDSEGEIPNSASPEANAGIPSLRSGQALRCAQDDSPAARTVHPYSSSSANVGSQMPLFEPTAEDLVMLHVPDWAKGQVGRRLEMVRCCLNGDWRTRFSTKNQLNVSLARKEKISVRHLLRMTAKYRATITPRSPKGDATVLMDTPPGPARGEFRVLEDWMVADLNYFHLCHYTKEQCYDALVARIKEKQAASVAHLYRIPSRATVYRFLRGLNPLAKAQEQGSAALKAACGYMDRSWEDTQSGEMWCLDEWQVDAGAYLEMDARIFGRPWIVTLLDARSRFILAWTVTFKYSHETVLDLVERAARMYGRPDFFYSDKGGTFRGRLGHRFRAIDKGKLLDPAASALEILGTERRGPREEKNPRANPLERRHRLFAESARLLPTWCGSHTDERPEEFDVKLVQHEAWICGKTKEPALLKLSEIEAWFAECVARFNSTPSGANGLHGLAPANAYCQFSTDADRERRRVTEGDIILALAESFPGVAIRQGGVIELPDRVRYSHAQLLLIQGERRDLKRARHDKSFIVVLPAFKGEEPITAWRRDKVGTHDPESLSRNCELLASIRKIAVSARPLPDRTTAETRGERQETSFSTPEPAVSMEWDRATAGPTPQRAWSSETTEGFAEETETAAAPVPRLHDLAPMTVEEQ